MSDRKATILAAMLRVKEEDFTSAGKPSVDALNAILEADDDAPITAKERDKHWAVFFEMSSEDPDTPVEAVEDEPVEDDPVEFEPVEVILKTPGFTTVIVTKAASSPVHLFVHGVGAFTLPHGEPVMLPNKALDALNNSDVQYKIGGAA